MRGGGAASSGPRVEAQGRGELGDGPAAGAGNRGRHSGRWRKRRGGGGAAAGQVAGGGRRRPADAEEVLDQEAGLAGEGGLQQRLGQREGRRWPPQETGVHRGRSDQAREHHGLRGDGRRAKGGSGWLAGSKAHPVGLSLAPPCSAAGLAWPGSPPGPARSGAAGFIVVVGAQARRAPK